MTALQANLHTANTQDFNDMRSMLTEIEQSLIGVDPVTQLRFYQPLQNRLYDMLTDAQDHTNILLYPEHVEYCLN